MATDIPNTYICGIGMITAVGDSAAMTAASVRAGINRYQESDILNKQSNAMKLAVVPDEALPDLNEQLVPANLTARQTRMLRLAHAALQEAASNLPENCSPPLFLAVPESIPAAPAPVYPAFLDHLLLQSGVGFDRDNSIMYTTGRAGGYIALEAAMTGLANGIYDYVLLGGVDSCVDTMLLSILDKDDRILAENIMDGFAPGEGAGFLLLTSESAKHALGPNEYAAVFINAPGIATELGHRYNEDDPYKGDGLAEAFTLALENSGVEKISTIFSSLNGESFGGKEYGVARIRNSGKLHPDAQLHHPAQNFGDIGAAFTPVLIGLAAIGMLKAYIPAPALIYSSSEFEYRGACCVNID